jgi:hypothetical protein
MKHGFSKKTAERIRCELSPGYRQRLTNALGISECADERRQAQAYCGKPADRCKAGRAGGRYGNRTPRYMVGVGAIFHSHDRLTLRELKALLHRKEEGFASSEWMISR